MKKQIALALGLAVVSIPAMASKARLEALGQDQRGSQFLDDDRSVFLNPAELNNHKDFVTFEWGDTSSTTDSASTPRAEGGVFRSSGNMVYGIYLGDERNKSNSLRNSLVGDVLAEEQNTTTLFVGGDAGVQWGASLFHQEYENKQGTDDIKSSAMSTRIGVISGDVEAFGNIGLGNTAEKGSTELEGKADLSVGVNYSMGDLKVMAYYYADEFEESTSKEKVKQNITKIGMAKEYKLNDKATMWSSVWYVMDKTECDTSLKAACANTAESVTSADENSITELPVGFALEIAAKDWLTLRASVSQSVFINTYDNGSDKATQRNTTKVAAGAGIVFGDLTIDGMIGNDTTCGDANLDSDSDSSTQPQISCSTNTNSNNGILNTNNILSRVSMTYKF